MEERTPLEKHQELEGKSANVDHIELKMLTTLQEIKAQAANPTYYEAKANQAVLNKQTLLTRLYVACCDLISLVGRAFIIILIICVFCSFLSPTLAITASYIFRTEGIISFAFVVLYLLLFFGQKWLKRI